MACIRKRRGKYVVDYRDPAQKRRWVTCDTRREAEAVYAEVVRVARQPTRPVVDPDITVADYAAHWLGQVTVTVKRRTRDIYQGNLRRHILPALGALKVTALDRGRLKAFLAAKLAAGLSRASGRNTSESPPSLDTHRKRQFARRSDAGLSRASVKLLLCIIQGLLAAAVDDGIIVSSPADRLGRALKLARSAASRQDLVKAFTRAQLAGFLTAAARVAPRWFAIFFLMARTGLRPGEALAVQWPDVGLEGQELRVARAFSDGRLEDTPKGNRGRTVDVSPQLADVLRRLLIQRKTETLREGWGEVPAWVFCTRTGAALEIHGLERAFKRVCKAAGLPAHFTPHCLRHTYASLLLQAGVSPVYVQHQLGHASIRLTCDLYGRWLPMGNQTNAALLDDPSGSKTVAAAAWLDETLDSIESVVAGSATTTC